MPQQNRVTPFGEIVAIEQRGAYLGNRGQIHRGHEIVRPWQVRRWITCALAFKGWVAPKWDPHRYTALFFFDEAVALAAGHRPCAECRHADFRRWSDAWAAAFGERQGADDMDRGLHRDRVDEQRLQRRHTQPWSALPDGTFVVVDGSPIVVHGERLSRWRAGSASYEPGSLRPTTGDAEVLTPRCTVEVLRHGYAAMIRS